MKKNSEKKINWKKVAAFGGVFVLGVATGVIGGKKALEYIINNEDICLDQTRCMFRGKSGIKLVMKCEKAGIALPMKLPRSSVEGMLDMIDGKPFDLEKFFSEDF